MQIDARLKKKFTEKQIIRILQEAKSETKIIDLCRKYGISDAKNRAVVHSTEE
ncbi:hypothetical protein C4544_07260 [candidate division WS5 bacterium]|uniref:Transposase n=1 Tax=candidate division WS5 bacterium TaxID=2093353 RepID=A0A419D9X3_9BACT|nr:MAG: hypothetical protein C4544_07260 [candidate division WS5 bacterium]